jgi:hypothetical protein
MTSMNIQGHGGLMRFVILVSGSPFLRAHALCQSFEFLRAATPFDRLLVAYPQPTPCGNPASSAWTCQMDQYAGGQLKWRSGQGTSMAFWSSWMDP